MALMECPECRHQVSDRALSCPSCGCPVRAGLPGGSSPILRFVMRRMTEKMLLGIAVVGAAVWLIHSLPFAFFRGHLSYYTAKVIPCAAFLLYFLVRFIREP